MKEKTSSTLFTVQAAMVAALYVALTWVSHIAGLDSGQIQVRISEALCVLPAFSFAAVPGLFVGCVLSNLLVGAALPDIIFGSLATLIGAVFCYRFRKKLWVAPIPNIVANTVIIPFVLLFAYGIKPLWLSFLTVGAGEIIAGGVLGYILLRAIKGKAHLLFKTA